MAVRAAAAGDDATACEAWLLAGDSAAAADVHRAEAIYARALALAEQKGLVKLRARALAALGGLDVLRLGSSERVALALRRHSTRAWRRWRRRPRMISPC